MADYSLLEAVKKAYAAASDLATAIANHEAKADAHPISGVNGLQAALDAANAKITELEKWPQSGSTATTQWIKHKDGTMQATAVLKSYGVAINTPLGQLFQSTEIVNVALPPGFISAPICSFSVEFVSGTVRPIPIPVGGERNPSVLCAPGGDQLNRGCVRF